MASSYVSLGNFGFWSPDSLLEILAWFVGSRLEEERSEPWTSQYGSELKRQARAGLAGCIDLRLDSLAPAQLDHVASVAEEVASSMTQEPLLLSASELNRLGLGGESSFNADVDPRHVRAIATMLSSLVNGSLRWTADDAEALPSHWLHASKKPL